MSTTRYSPEILPEMDFTTPETMNQSVEQRTDFIWKRLLQSRKQAEKDGLNGKTSDNIQEGENNQFFTVDKVRRALDAIDPLRYDYRSGRFEINVDNLIARIDDSSSAFIRKNGSVDFISNQSMGGYSITEVASAEFLNGKYIRDNAYAIVVDSDVIANGNNGYLQDGDRARFAAVAGDSDENQAGLVMEYGYGLCLSIFSSHSSGRMGDHTLDVLRILESYGESAFLVEPVPGVALTVGGTIGSTTGVFTAPSFILEDSDYPVGNLTLSKSDADTWTIDTPGGNLSISGPDMYIGVKDSANSWKISTNGSSITFSLWNGSSYVSQGGFP